MLVVDAVVDHRDLHPVAPGAVSAENCGPPMTDGPRLRFRWYE
jgi:hypothetical protein